MVRQGGDRLGRLSVFWDHDLGDRYYAFETSKKGNPSLAFLPR